MSAADPAMYAPVATRVFRRNGVFAHGVTVSVFSLRSFLPRLIQAIMQGVTTAGENLCVLCGIVPGAIEKCKRPGRFGLSLKFAADAGGQWIRIFGIFAHGANKI